MDYSVLNLKNEFKFVFLLLMNGVPLRFGLDSLTIKATPSETIKYNESVTFECDYTYAEGRDSSLFAYAIWKNNGRTLGKIDSTITSEPTGTSEPTTAVTFYESDDRKYIKTSYTLSAVNCSHIGNYTCVLQSRIGNRNRTKYELKKHIFLDITAVRQKPIISSEDGRMLYTENDVVSFTCLAVTGRPPVSSKIKVTFTNGTTKHIHTTSTVTPMQDSCIKQERLNATIKLTRNHKAILCSVTEELSSELPLSVNYQKKTDQSKKATVVAVTVGFLVVFLVGIVGGFLAYKYKRPKKQQNIEDFDEDDNENSSRISSSSSGEKGSRRKRSKRSKKSRK